MVIYYIETADTSEKLADM